MSTRDQRRPSGRLGRLLDRVVSLRRAGAADRARSSSREAIAESEVVQRLQQRLDHVERELEGLQDSVHRESRRRDEEMAALRRQLEPGEMARSLSADARKRGV